MVKNEEKHLEKCLESVKDFVDEIIIVDTGSKDNTKEIVQRYTDKIFNFKWNNDFSKARNFSLSKATKKWILVLDADEIITKKDMKKIIRITNKTKENAFYLIQRNYTNDKSRSRWQFTNKSEETKHYEGYVRNPIIRLFRNNKGIKYSGPVHEVVDTSLKGPVKTLDIAIHHYYEEKSLQERQLKYLKIAENALKKKPSGRLYASAGAVHLHFTKDYEKSLEYFQKAADLNYKKSICLEGVAESLINLRRYKEAYDVYKKLAKSGYLTTTLCNNIANLLVMYKHYKEGLKFLKLAIKLGSPNRERIEKNIKAIEKIIH